MTDAKTRKIELSDAREDFGALIDEAAEGSKRILLEQDGTTVAALISTADYRLLLAMDARREALFSAMAATQAAFADVPPEEVEREIEKALKKIRREASQPTPRRTKTPA